jgi:hypothetical protein
MRFRTTVAAVVLAGAATLPLSGVALAEQPDRDCPDFSSQKEAQAAFDSRTGDPERLDKDKDGIACESYFGEPEGDDDKSNDKSDEGQVRTKPRGGVETGDGTTEGSGGIGTVLLILSGVGAGSAAVVTSRRRTATHSG